MPCRFWLLRRFGCSVCAAGALCSSELGVPAHSSSDLPGRQHTDASAGWVWLPFCPSSGSVLLFVCLCLRHYCPRWAQTPHWPNNWPSRNQPSYMTEAAIGLNAKGRGRHCSVLQRVCWILASWHAGMRAWLLVSNVELAWACVGGDRAALNVPRIRRAGSA